MKERANTVVEVPFGKEIVAVDRYLELLVTGNIALAEHYLNIAAKRFPDPDRIVRMAKAEAAEPYINDIVMLVREEDPVLNVTFIDGSSLLI